MRLTKKDVLRLIRTDLMLTKILSAQQSIGFDNVNFDLYIDEIIFKSMGLNNHDARVDATFDKYMELAWRVKEIDVIKHPDQFKDLVAEVYRFLVRLRKDIESGKLDKKAYKKVETKEQK